MTLSRYCQSTNVTIVRKKFVNVKFTLDKRSLHNREEKAAEGAKETTSSEDLVYDGEKYLVNMRENTKVSVVLPEETVSGADTVFVQFQIKNRKPQKDVAVWMEGIRNKLTSESHVYANHNTQFTYVTALEQGQKSLEMILGKGEYEISDMHCFAGNVTTAGEELCQAKLRPDQEKTKGDQISGTISVPENGYLITSIPYDEGFEIQIDGKRVEKERVNTAFLGCRTEKGIHEIEIVYKAPGVRVGKLLSVLGCGLLLGILIVPRRARNKGDY